MLQLRRWPWFVAILALIATGATVAAVRSDRDRGDVHWDPRLAPYVRFVERERGLRFTHPVRTDFLSDKAFRAEVTGGEAPSTADIAEQHHVEGLFRALGLVEGTLDLRSAIDTLNGEEILGLYDPDRDRVLVRGSRITPDMRPTIVHELTHALQAQHFDLDRTGRTSGAGTAFTSLVEADALRIEDKYVASLSTKEQDALDASARAQAGAADVKGVPPILSELFSLPYVLGPPFVDALIDAGGTAAVNRALRNPPTTEEHIVDPDAYLGGDRPTQVTTPRLAAGEKRAAAPDDFGMVSLLLVLGERVPFAQAWTAVEGWKGDASVSFRSRHKDCIRVRTAFDTAADAVEFLAAAETWAGGRSTASVEADGDLVELRSCDPGTGSSTADAGRPRTFDLLQLRVELVASLRHAGTDHRQAMCVADAVFRDHDPAALLAAAAVTDAKDPELLALQRDVALARGACR